MCTDWFFLAPSHTLVLMGCSHGSIYMPSSTSLKLIVIDCLWCMWCFAWELTKLTGYIHRQLYCHLPHISRCISQGHTRKEFLSCWMSFHSPHTVLRKYTGAVSSSSGSSHCLKREKYRDSLWWYQQCWSVTALPGRWCDIPTTCEVSVNVYNPLSSGGVPLPRPNFSPSSCTTCFLTRWSIPSIPPNSNRIKVRRFTLIFLQICSGDKSS